MRKIECEVCGRSPDCPQLKDDVWALVARSDQLLCLEHAEERLGRHVQPEDLADCPANVYAKKNAARNMCDCVDEVDTLTP